MNDTQFERVIAILLNFNGTLVRIEGHLERIADTLDSVTATVTDEEGNDTTVLNIWKEGESE